MEGCESGRIGTRSRLVGQLRVALNTRAKDELVSFEIEHVEVAHSAVIRLRRFLDARVTRLKLLM